MLELRALIFAIARAVPAVGALEETLKWGETAIWLRLCIEAALTYRLSKGVT
jgi:hypothetical protein